MSSTKSEDDTSKDQKDEVECVRPFAKNSLEPKRMLRPWLTDEDSNYYKMDHSKRGIAVIFNQENFTNLNLPLRSGAIDCDNLNFTLRNLGFEVSLCQNKTLKNIRKTLKTVANTDHSESDCLIIVVLSFGKHDYLYASDTSYKVESLCNYFTADKCPTLAGKPKLFFIQAGCCNVIKPGTSCEQRGTEDLSKATFRIEPDFLIVYSAIPSNCFRNYIVRPTWFIEALCLQLCENTTHYDLMTLLTFVSYYITTDYYPTLSKKLTEQQKQQIPCITSMLTRLIKFTPK